MAMSETAQLASPEPPGEPPSPVVSLWQMNSRRRSLAAGSRRNSLASLPAEYEETTDLDELPHPLALAYRKLSYIWSMLLLIFALVVTYWDIARGWTTEYDGAPSPGMVAVNAIVFTVLLVWAAILEGAQCSIVGLSSVDIESFKHTHPQS